MNNRPLLLSFLWCLFVLFSSLDTYAQAPEAFNYQAVLRDSKGVLLSSELVNLKVSILSGGHGEILDYIETHIVV